MVEFCSELEIGCICDTQAHKLVVFQGEYPSLGDMLGREFFWVRGCYVRTQGVVLKTFGAKTKHILSSKRRALINAKPFSLMVRCPSIANATPIKSYIRHLFNGAGAKRALNFKQCVYLYSKIPCVLYVDSTTNIFICQLQYNSAIIERTVYSLSGRRVLAHD